MSRRVERQRIAVGSFFSSRHDVFSFSQDVWGQIESASLGCPALVSQQGWAVVWTKQNWDLGGRVPQNLPQVEEAEAASCQACIVMYGTMREARAASNLLGTEGLCLAARV